MRKPILSFLMSFVFVVAFAQGEAIHHRLNVKIAPDRSYIEVTDTISGVGPGEIILGLNTAFQEVSFSKNAEVVQLRGNEKAKDVGMDREDSDYPESGVSVNRWSLKLKRKSNWFVVHYSGTINGGYSSAKEDYQRGFSETSGIIIDKGIYLAGSTHWVPTVGDKLVTYRLQTTLPEGWKTVSTGERTYTTTRNGEQTDVWECDRPQEEVFLIGARFTEYTYTMNSGIEAMAFLRTPDEGLANRYLEVTEQYMEMYRGLIGDFPYSKFALVENFWETGYGMPSFTLLGEKIIRFPFILHSSYPHELLHNWWGNSVYVDFSTGNWCEGLTAYEADHLIKEQRGQGEEYRRSTLQKYTNVVDASNDFPLSDFISRHNASTEAIGYGKSMMMWHMLRRKLGDEDFIKGFALFNKNFAFKKASFDNIRQSMETVSGTDLSAFFKQWVQRKGAPELEITDVSFDKYNQEYRLFLTLEQIQPGEPFDLDVPVVIATEKGLQTKVIKLNTKSTNFQFSLKTEPLKLAIDPQYDVFRLLNPNEVPAAWSKVLASPENIFVFPSTATDEQQKIYREFVRQWTEADSDKYEIVFDDNISELPANKTSWILGFENKFAADVQKAIAGFGADIESDSVKFQSVKTVRQGHSFICTVYDARDANRNIAFISVDNEKAIPGLVRKLPHYGKYSFLAFEGDEPVNVDKGLWPITNSPMVKVFQPDASGIDMKTERKALATLAPVFSEKKMLGHIEYLASDELKGRGLGTPEIDTAAGYIRERFIEYGLQPMERSYYQQFSHTFADKGKLGLTNVVGVIPGTDDEFKDSPVVLSAHYDHLGLGWPDVRKGNKGLIHNGADDNASGVSIMLELARIMGKTVKPKRTIIFVAFSGEEAGLIGSRYFVDNLGKYFQGTPVADINLDTDGRLGENKLMVINASSAKEWKFVFMGTDYTTGVKSELITQELDASDQVSFIEKGIPAIQLFAGANEDYHRPTDTFDKIDGKGLVKVATVAREVLVYMADREEPFEFTGKMKEGNPRPAEKSRVRKRASTGSVPDFSYSGEGVKISSVMKDSAGEKAGLQAGDVIKAIDGEKVTNLMEYSQALKRHQPGETVTLDIQRSEKVKSITITLGER